MTTVGIQFVTAQENIRHNRAMEYLTGQEIAIKSREADIKSREADIKQGTLDESIRHDLVSEAQNWYDVESKRITANANASQAQTARDRLDFDISKYEQTGRALEQAQTYNQYAQAANQYAQASLAKSNVKVNESVIALNQSKKQLAEEQSQAQRIENIVGWATLDAQTQYTKGLVGAQQANIRKVGMEANYYAERTKYVGMEATAGLVGSMGSAIGAMGKLASGIGTATSAVNGVVSAANAAHMSNAWRLID